MGRVTPEMRSEEADRDLSRLLIELNQLEDEERLFTCVADFLAAHTMANRCTVTRPIEGSVYEIVALSQTSLSLQGTRFDISGSTIEAALQSGGTVLRQLPITKAQAQFHEPEVRWVLCTPLKVSQECFGTLNLSFIQQDIAATQTTELAENLAALLASHLSRLRSARRTQAQLQQVQQLHTGMTRVAKAATELAQTRSESEAIRRIGCPAAELFDAEWASVTLFIAGQPQHALTQRIDHGELTEPAPFEVAGSMVERACAQDSTVRVDVMEKTQFRERADLESCGMRSAMTHPISIEGEAIGTLNVSSVRAEAFTRADEIMLGQMCTLLAGTIRRARLLKREQEARQVAEQALEARSAFLANVSHEIRTPMNGVLGMISLLAETDLQDDQREFVDVIRGSSETLLGLLNDLLDLAKSQSFGLSLHNVAFEVESLIRETVLLYQGQCTMKGLTLELLMPQMPEPGTWVQGDPIRLRQILSNLLSNAVKFTSKGGVTVRASWRSDQLQVQVQDSGIGIPAEAHERIFTAFEQVDASTTRRYGGTGLGLSICKRLCELMGGHLELDRHSEHGATFRFEVPMAGTGAHTADIVARIPRFSPDAERPRVLVVDDDRVNRLVAQRMLQRFGLTVDLAEDGEAGVEAASHTHYALIFMDIQMPGMDGLQATSIIRHQQGQAVPIVALTANAMDEQRENALAAGMNEFVTKPLSLQSLEKPLATFLPGYIRGPSRPTTL